MDRKKRYNIHAVCRLAFQMTAVAVMLGGCGSSKEAEPVMQEEVSSEPVVIQAVPETIAQLGLDGRYCRG